MAAPCSASSPRPFGAVNSPVDELNRVPLGFNCYVIRTGDHTILIETGGGDKMDARGPRTRQTPARPGTAARGNLAATASTPNPSIS